MHIPISGDNISRYPLGVLCSGCSVLRISTILMTTIAIETVEIVQNTYPTAGG